MIRQRLAIALVCRIFALQVIHLTGKSLLARLDVLHGLLEPKQSLRHLLDGGVLG
ncbi:hypothetical protein [Bradyrhizobium sp. LTSPM299]|uniref:hypothetical protein n=1 Tax=Bradyrhizobium sp. LTSPM299 TaxID=1619233 RepID=UPI000B05F477|nr:hypothetical protein [Bradyrhizobium sp. LTSPM299]